jgi:hypothetical protein
MGRASYHYLNSTTSDLYSGVSFGYSQARFSFSGFPPLDRSASGGWPAFNLNLIGYRYLFGGRFGAFVELGVGFNGVAAVGLSGRI